MIAGGPLLEHTTTVIPFGFRAWDSVERRPVRDGLEVICRWAHGRSIHLWPTPSGVFTTGSIPELRTFGQGAGDDAFWADRPTFAGQGVIEVRDRSGRFLPFRMTVAATHRAGRLAREVCGIPGSPPWDLVPLAGDPPERTMPVVTLFSSPSRPAPPGMASVRVQLVTLGGAPAAAAILEVKAPNAPRALGLADARGIAVIHVPWPPPDGQLQPQPAPARPLALQQWDGVVVRVWFAGVVPPDVAAGVATSAGSPGSEVLPDLCEVLAQTLEDPVLALDSEPSTPLPEQTLRFGQPLVLRTAGHHELLIDPGA